MKTYFRVTMSKDDEKDVRRTYLLRVASHILGLNIVEEKLRQLQPIETFCDTNAMLLIVSLTEQRGIELSNMMKSSTLPRVVFYKTRPTVLTTDNYKAMVNVMSMIGASNEVFLKSVQNVFSKDIAESLQTTSNKHLLSLVSELEENLLATVDSGKDRGEGGVVSLADEIRVWKSRSGTAAQQYNEAFEPLQIIIDTIEDRPVDELIGLVEAFEDTCDALWNSQPPYPESRMRSLIQCMASYLCEQVTAKIDGEKLWKEPEVIEQLNAGIAACTQWDLSVQLMTGQTWKRQAEDAWKGDPVDMKYLQGFKKRLEEVLSLKQLGPQIGLLLNERGVEAEVEKTIETAMRNTAVLAYNPFTEHNWKSKVLVAERALDPIIDRTIPILKSRLQPNKLESNHLTADLEKYKNFLCRTKIKEKLQNEREVLLAQLSSKIADKEREIVSRMASYSEQGRFLTEIAAKVVWIRQQSNKLEKMHSLCSALLDDLSSYSILSSRMTSFMEKLKQAEQENYDQWCRETIQAIDDPTDSIALETKGKIMVLEQKRGTLNVNYSDRLLRLLKEVRQLASLGLNIPSKIINCVNQGEKFYRYGVVLKQIAHFYNTIDQQMLPCQQALMLDEAIAFERLVIPKKNEESAITRVTWEDPKQLEDFIAKLQAASDKLSNHNRRLRNVHTEIVQMVLELVNLDVLKEVNKWKEILSRIRSKISEEELVHGATKANLQPWQLHWNWQLYKALQLQYQWGLESLHTQIPLIHTQLVFVQQKLQLRPPIEEIRAKYYKEMRKLLSIPEKFKGVLEGEQMSKFFAAMLGKNADRFPSVYEKAEQLMRAVERVDVQFADWLVLAQVDLEQLIEEKLTKASDWEMQLKLLKTKGREAEKLPNEIRLECIVVSTAGAKSAIDELLQRLFDTLTWTLRLSINTKLQAIQQFLTQAINVLSSRPQSVDEVAEANARHTEYNRTNKELKASWAVLNEQHTLLRSVAGSGVDQMSSLTDQWEKFELMLDSHQMMIKEQVEVLKSNVDVRVKALNDESEKLLARWNQFKPKSDALQGDRQAMLKANEFIKEKRLEYDELTAKREKLEKESDQFDLKKPEFFVLDELGADIQEYENNWVIYEEFNTELQTLADEEWIVFRSKTYLFDELLQKWMEKLKSAQQTHMGVRLLKEIDTFKEFSGCLKFCRGEMLSTDHWLEMFRLLQLPRGTTLEKLRFGDLISVAPNVIQNVEQLKALNAKAQGEVTIREAIQELEMWAAQAEFSFSDYKHSNGSNMKVIRDWKESINSVKDSQALLQSLKNSPFYAQFSDKTNVWETRLSDLDVYLPQMNDIQRKWIYLEPIFGRGALPAEASRFARVDSEFRLILADVVRDARLVSLCSRHSLKKSLEQIIDQLNRCQKALNQFLEEKRSAFPRFYFLGDDDLLEILGQSTNATVIQSHLKKLFQGIDKVVFGANNETISAMLSVQGEHVPLSRPVRVVPQVEIWLQNLSDEMRSTLKKLSVEAIREENVDPARYPSQVLCLAEQVRFCRDCEQALDGSRDFAKLKASLQEQLKTYTNTKVNDVVLDLKLKALILDLIHHIDVVDQLISNKASSSQCWTWQRQLRFYLVGDGVVARQVNSEFNYTYEYQGNTPKLVHTPLTDKCYLTLTQAMYMGLGGNPYGPAGTGKTESVKALASLFGRQVLVFNCDEGIDVHSMSRIFVGIVQCGAWGCFDEFNRLDQASVDPNAAIFITLNPAGKGYGGRQKMPDNLKQLFRPVVMSVPDNDVIAETILYSEGFTDAKNLARKIVTIFKLSKEMLSAQQHYDWGLRALKVVLRGCGDIRAAKPEANETETVVQALLLNTLSKLTFADSKRFSVLIDDVFSTVNKEMTTLQKVFQLHEQLRQRIGVVVVGPTGAGKSTIWRVLRRAQLLAGVALHTVSFNPKAMNRTKLLGHMDIDTREWSDGILTMAAREVIKDTSVHQWIIFDGDIDPEWVEALNSVLDDNRLVNLL
nr:Dynein heavy chain and ATPase associated with various cellular activities domain containing protein [Haemonchus contortus]